MNRKCRGGRMNRKCRGGRLEPRRLNKSHEEPADHWQRALFGFAATRCARPTTPRPKAVPLSRHPLLGPSSPPPKVGGCGRGLRCRGFAPLGRKSRRGRGERLEPRGALGAAGRRKFARSRKTPQTSKSRQISRAGKNAQEFPGSGRPLHLGRRANPPAPEKRSE